MSAGEIARRCFETALRDAADAGVASDAIARSMLSLAISAFLKERSVNDVRDELLAAADNIDPDTDYVFMRP
jgi:hypothetical protein